jgi:hypothetical protein
VVSYLPPSKPTVVAVMLGNGDATFKPAQTVLSTSGATYFAQSLAVGDFNGDGFPDVALSNSSMEYVSINGGDGTFYPAHSFAAPPPQLLPGPAGLMAADVNGDGRIDLVQNGAVLLGNGDGTFKARQTFPGGGYGSFTLADVNGDGILDEVESNGSAVGILLGNGNGTFRSTGISIPGTDVVAADVNGDGITDIVTVSGTGTSGLVAANILLGNGNGTFKPTMTFQTPSLQTLLAIADVNGDGRPDLVVGSYSSGNVSVLEGAAATFTGQTIVVPPVVNSISPSTTATNVTSISYTVTFSDNVTGVDPTDFRVVTTGAIDGTPQIAVAPVSASVYTVTISGLHGSGGVQLNLLDNDSIKNASATPLGGPGAGNGSFAGPASTLQQVFPTLLSIQGSAPSTSSGSASYTVRFSEPVTGVDPTDFHVVTGGAVAWTGVSVTPASSSVYNVSVNGLTGVGTVRLDLVDDGTIRDFDGNPLVGGGGFTPPTTVASISKLGSVVLADLNGDGKVDLVAVNRSLGDPSAILSVCEGNGDGTFQPTATYSIAQNSHYNQLQIADVNGDGIPDLVVSYLPFESTFVAVMLGNGNATFKAPQSVFTTAPNVFAGPAPLSVGDLNADGAPDIAFIGSIIGAYVAVNKGNGTFYPQHTFPAGLSRLQIADINGDGRADLVGPGSFLLGNGDGTFKPSRTFSAGDGAFALSDINADGKLDEVVADFSRVDVILGNGDGIFQTPLSFATVSSPYWLIAADVNGDGITDIVTVNTTAKDISVLLGNGDGTFRPQMTYATTAGQTFVGLADVNGDGRPDLVVGSYSGGNVSVLEGAASSFTGQTMSVMPYLNVVSGTPSFDSITLTQDPDHQHIDWKLGTTTAQISINDPAGLTINGNGGNDFISFSYTNGNPLPNHLTLHGTFTLSGLTGTDPLIGTTFDLTTSTVYGSLGNFLNYIRNGYDRGKWDGVATPTTGAITSSSAANDPLHSTGIGWAESADGYIKTQPIFSLELAFAKYGDTDLNGIVDQRDLIRYARFYPKQSNATWDQGDFNYDGAVDSTDLALLTSNYHNRLAVRSITGPKSSGSLVNTPTIDFTVTFSTDATGVDPSDFRIVTTGDVYTSPQVTVTPQSASVYTVTIQNVHGTGTVQLNLADDDSIQDSTGYPLGGPGPGNGSFAGPTYTVQQVFPTVVSITSMAPSPDPTTVSYTVTFNEPVTGVDPTDFIIQPGGSLAYTGVTVTPVSGSVYTVNITGLSGVGTVGLILSDNETIRDLAGNTLTGQSVFVALTTAAVASKPVATFTADLNGDGNADLIVTTQLGIQTLLGHGDGTFSPSFSAAIGGSFRGLQIADVHGDGTPDLLVSYNFLSSLDVQEFEGKGDGTFRPLGGGFHGLAQFLVSNQPVAVGDLNHDGLPDAVGADDVRIYVEINAGGGNYYLANTYVLSDGSQSVAIADVNGDGNADIVLDNAVLLGNGDGTFRQPITFASVPSNRSATSLVVVNMNGDSKPDIALTDQYTGDLFLFFGNGDGTFQPAQTFATGPWSAIADMTGDGKLDIVGGNSSTHTLAIYPGNGDGTFAPALTWDVLTPFQGFAVADVNGDGRPDLLYADNSGGTVNVLQSSGQVFTAPTSVVGALPVADSVTVPSGASQITLNRDPDGTEIDWTTGQIAGKLAVSDPNGLTITADRATMIAVNFDYSGGNPLPDTLHLSGTFLINGLTGDDPLAGKTLEIGRSTVLFNYIWPPSPTARILQYLKSGYANGTWTGVVTPASGVITSTAAANSNGLCTLGWADWADGVVAGQRPQCSRCGSRCRGMRIWMGR